MIKLIRKDKVPKYILNPVDDATDTVNYFTDNIPPVTSTAATVSIAGIGTFAVADISVIVDDAETDLTSMNGHQVAQVIRNTVLFKSVGPTSTPTYLEYAQSITEHNGSINAPIGQAILSTLIPNGNSWQTVSDGFFYLTTNCNQLLLFSGDAPLIPVYNSDGTLGGFYSVAQGNINGGDFFDIVIKTFDVSGVPANEILHLNRIFLHVIGFNL